MARSGEKLAKTKVVVLEDGLKSAAVAVGTARGSLAQKVGLGKAPAVMAPKKKAVKKPVERHALASKKKAAPQKKVAAKKVVARKFVTKKAAPRPGVKKAKIPAKKK
jgi:hypothetical protein